MNKEHVLYVFVITIHSFKLLEAVVHRGTGGLGSSPSPVTVRLGKSLNLSVLQFPHEHIGSCRATCHGGLP